MSDNILPKIFEGFPELANEAEKLEVALDILSQRIETHLAEATAKNSSAEIEGLKEQLALSQETQNNMRAQIDELETSKSDMQQAVPTGFSASGEETSLKDEVSHWKEKYDALAGKFDSEIEAAKAVPADDSVLKEKDAQIAELTQSKDKAGSEIARLAEALALAKKEGETAKAQLESVNAQLEQVQSDLGDVAEAADTSALEDEIRDLKSAAAAAEEKMAELETACRTAEERAAASETARANASARLGSLIASLNAVHSAGAA